ncbi:MAG: cytochrome c, partial [Acidimicrobiia bacterium]|nr:cytochrome c [Acidimicrobiia bacterium]
MEISTIVITVAALAAIAWLAFLVANSMRGRGKEEVAPNLAPGITDDTLESKRLDKTLASAVVLSGILALSLPIYFVGEQSRQDGFVEEFDQVALERGAHLFEEFQCGNCHGVDGGGGAAAYVEKRSGISVAWSAPAINTVFYRYTPEEVRYWLVYGRANSPMPAWGLDGGGPLNDQQIDELMEYLQSADFIL